MTGSGLYILVVVLALPVSTLGEQEFVSHKWTSKDCGGDPDLIEVHAPAPMCYTLSGLPDGWTISNTAAETIRVNYGCLRGALRVRECTDVACARCNGWSSNGLETDKCALLGEITKLTISGAPKLGPNGINGAYELQPNQFGGYPVYKMIDVTFDMFVYQTPFRTIMGGTVAATWHVNDLLGADQSWARKEYECDYPWIPTFNPITGASQLWVCQGAAGATCASMSLISDESSRSGQEEADGITYFSYKDLCQDAQTSASCDVRASQLVLFTVMALCVLLLQAS